MPPKRKPRKLSPIKEPKRKVDRQCNQCQGTGKSGKPARDTLDDLVPRDVMTILNNLDIAKDDREKLEVQAKLEVIHDRVKNALQHAGMNTQIHPTTSETERHRNPAPNYNMKKKRAGLEKQRGMLEMITEYSSSLTSRRSILDDVSMWLESVDDLEDGVKTSDEIEALEAEYKRINQEVGEAMTYTESVVEKIRVIGYHLMKEAGLLESDDEDDPADRQRANLALLRLQNDRKELLDETSILAEPENYFNACAEVKATLDGAVKAARKNAEKNLIRHGIKQYKYLMKAMDRRMEENKDMGEEMLALNAKVDQLTRTSDRWKREYEAMERKNHALDNKVLKLNASITDLETKNAKLREEITEMIDLQKTLQDKQKSVVRIVEEPTILGGTKSDSQTILTSESTLNAAIKPYQEEVEKYKAEIEAYEKRVEFLEKKLKEEEEAKAKLDAKLGLNSVLESEMTSFENKMDEEKNFQLKSLYDANESMEKQIAKLISELECKNELIEYQELRLKDMKEELGTINLDDLEELADAATGRGKDMSIEMKRTLFRMKKECDAEIARMKNHVEREKTRSEAAMRKLEQVHRDQLQGVHKNSLHLLRAINRFKESVAVILEREALPVAANDVRRIPNLPAEESPADCRQMLNQMAGSAVELLVTVEFKLSQALMNKRLEIKDNSISKNFAHKDLEAQTEAVRKAKETGEFLAERLKEAKSKLAVAEETLSQFKKFEGDRYSKVAERYRTMTSQYISLQREMDKKKKEFNLDMKKKDKALRLMLTQRQSMRNILEEQQDVISSMQDHLKKQQFKRHNELRISVGDMKENMDLLEKAMEENKVNRDIYAMTVDILKRSMEIPVIRLRHLVEKYIAFRRLKSVRNALVSQISQTLVDDRQRELSTFIMHIDERLELTSRSWMAQTEVLDEQRRTLVEKMGLVFGDLVVETGLFFIQPECKSILSTKQDDNKSTISAVSRSTRSSLAPPGARMVGRPLHAELVGQRIHLLSPRGEEATWSLPSISHPASPVNLDTPLIVDMDVNQRMRAAKKALRRVKARVSMPMGKAEGFDYTNGEVTTLVSSGESFQSDTASTTYSSEESELQSRRQKLNQIAQAQN